jgi:immune inhibitor A
MHDASAGAKSPIASLFGGVLLLTAIGSFPALYAFAAAASTAPPASLPEVRTLSPVEARLWQEQGIDVPSTALAAQAARRAQGAVTEFNVAVVLVDFPDYPADRVLHPASYYEHMLFSREDDGFESVAEFFDRSSHGRFHLNGVVRGWFTVSGKRGDYTAGYSGIGYYPGNSQRLAEEAFWLADPYVNYSLLDNEGPDAIPDSGDDDEIVDGILVVHAGKGSETGGVGPNDFISLYWSTPSPMPLDGVFGQPFTLNPETGNIGVFIHEMGHLLGLPDLYDTGGESYGLGRWSIMSAGLNLDEGRTPSDFDAWCKIQLGFVDVTYVQNNLKDVVVPPTVDSGMVYRLWRQGEGTNEYFLLENRRAAGIDAALPGQGLLIYHVDDFVIANSNPNHYKVALEQADGLYQLENRFNDPSAGDDGDPYHAGGVFGRYTVPSSMDYRGADTYVHVYNIRGPDTTGAMTVDLSVEPGPLVELSDLTLQELEGNGDGLVSAGELAGVLPKISVDRLPARGLVLHAGPIDSLGTLLDQEVDFGDVPAGTSVVPPQPIRVRIGPSIPTDPYGLRLDLTLDWADAPGRNVPVTLGIGTVVGRSDDFEQTDHGWTHESVRPTAFDQWNYGPSFGAGATAGFKHGYFQEGYLRGCDAVLVSPTVLLPPHAALTFDQLVDIVSPDSSIILAGGVVEISVNGGDWQLAYPDAGYPTYYGGTHPEWKDRPMFAGRLHEGQFFPERVDLSAYSGSLQVRFRFYSEVGTRSGQGWHIDNVAIEKDVTPVRVLSAHATIAGPGVELQWELAEPLPAEVRWLRGSDPGAPSWSSPWVAAAGHGALLDSLGARSLPAHYWLQGLERDGTISRWGPWSVAATPSTERLTWKLLANPVRGTAEFQWEGSLPPRARLQVFDVSGRLVYDVPAASSDKRLLWDRRDRSGARVSSGIYLARLSATPAPTLRLVVLP